MNKRKVGGFLEGNMKNAVEKVVKNEFSLRVAAKNNGLKFQTLARYVKKAKANPHSEIRMCPNYEVRQVFDKIQENILVDYITHMARLCYGLTPGDVRKLAYQTAERNNISKIPKSWKTEKMAGKKWFTAFRKRHPQLSIRKPENCSLARASAFNRHTVSTFFDKLEEVYSRNSQFLSGHCIWNYDETSTATVSRSPKILAEKGVHQVNQITSSERGLQTTTGSFISAGGNTLPPIIVYPRAKFQTYMTRGAPPGTRALCSSKGWMTDELFPDVIAHFIKFSNASEDNPMILIYDNHSSHLSLAALLLAKQNGITVLTIPPHTSHKLQPLDVSVYSSFKGHFSQASKKWMELHPGQTMKLADLPELISYAHLHAMTPSNILSGFRKTGIFPFNRDIFTEDDYSPSNTTDRSNPETEILCDELPDTSVPTFKSSELSTPDLEPSTSFNVAQNIQSSSTQFEPKNIRSRSNFISPFHFKGVPKAAPRKKENRGRKPKQCIIATDSLEQQCQKRKVKKQKQSKTVKKSKIKLGESSDEESEPMRITLSGKKKSALVVDTSGSDGSSSFSDTDIGDY
ncbi:hypothetical protein V9T40_012018 [Parthenolecanium corni]|uniref:HTH CENPB-type domain-containing protein n=1 Tax=Parthenolecanium corni TaxID=536013 RepID=A0AAN9XYY4_9HEMI